MLLAAYYILNTAYYTLRTTYCILHTPYCTLHTTYYILHTTYNIQHTTYYILHTTYCILHTTHYILHTTYYILQQTLNQSYDPALACAALGGKQDPGQGEQDPGQQDPGQGLRVMSPRGQDVAEGGSEARRGVASRVPSPADLRLSVRHAEKALLFCGGSCMREWWAMQ